MVCINNIYSYGLMYRYLSEYLYLFIIIILSLLHFFPFLLPMIHQLLLSPSLSPPFSHRPPLYPPPSSYLLFLSLSLPLSLSLSPSPPQHLWLCTQNPSVVVSILYTVTLYHSIYVSL